jgi:hypothetical protein
MKFKIAFLILMTIATLSSARTPFRAIAKDAFIYMKMPKELLGGNIQVKDTAGNVVNTIAIDHRKVYLDFFELADGRYKVTLKHDDMLIEFIYSVDSTRHHSKRKHAA